MGFLKRLFGGGEAAVDDEPGQASASAPSTRPSALDDEQARDRQLLREEAERLSDDLIQRQMRYADRSWTPPAQGGTRRADDEDAKRDAAT
jgi:hypothetical protein